MLAFGNICHQSIAHKKCQNATAEANCKCNLRFHRLNCSGDQSAFLFAHMVVERKTIVPVLDNFRVKDFSNCPNLPDRTSSDDCDRGPRICRQTIYLRKPRSLATLLAERGITGAPVVDSDGRLMGVISEGDLLHRAEIGTVRRHRVRRRSWWLDHFAADLAREYVKSHGRTVKEIMTRDVVTVTEDTELAEVAALLEAKRIKRVPVMREGKIVGIISRANIVRAVGATKGTPPREGEGDDRSIRASLLAELGREEWARVWPEDILVRDGIAHFWISEDEPSEKGRRCGSRRKRSLASRNTSSPPQWSPHSNPHPPMPLRMLAANNSRKRMPARPPAAATSLAGAAPLCGRAGSLPILAGNHGNPDAIRFHSSIQRGSI